MKLRKLISILLAAVILITGVSASFAEAQQDREAEREAKLARLENLAKRRIRTNLHYDIVAILKSAKLYGRKIVGVTEDAEWEFGPWEILYQDTYIASSDSFDLYFPGTYYAFAWSVDIMWGTDWPYSGVFWNKPDTPVDTIEIMMTGKVRSANVYITVNGTKIVNDVDCDSHSEWRPWPA